MKDREFTGLEDGSAILPKPANDAPRQWGETSHFIPYVKPPPGDGWQPMQTVPAHDGILLWARSDNTVDGATIGDLKGWDEPEVHSVAYSFEGKDGVRTFVSEALDGWDEDHMKLWPLAWKLDPTAVI